MNPQMRWDLKGTRWVPIYQVTPQSSLTLVKISLAVIVRCTVVLMLARWLEISEMLLPVVEIVLIFLIFKGCANDLLSYPQITQQPITFVK